MRKLGIVASVLLFAGLACASFAQGAPGSLVPVADNVLTPEEEAAGWQLLFDGETMTGWSVLGEAEGWAIQDGVLSTVPDRNGGYIATDGRYGDFVLSVDFMVSGGANSGVFFRWDDLGNPVDTGIEAQILDSFGADVGVHDCAAIYECVAPVANVCKPAGEWQNMQIACNDNVVVVVQNGMPVVVMDLNKWTEPHQNPDGTGNKVPIAYKDMAREGHIGLQHHGHEVWFKNIKILPLDE